MKDFFKGFGQIGMALVVCVVFILIAKLALRGYFLDACYPVYEDYTDWVNIFESFFVKASVVAVVLNILYVVFASFVKGPFEGKGAWWLELIVSVVVGAIFAITFSKLFPEDTSCIVIVEIMFIAEGFLSFFIGSFFANSLIKYRYNPILSFFNKR